MAYNSQLNTSLFGRRFGLQNMSTGQSGGSRGARDYLVGPESLRVASTTAETTATNLDPFGISYLPGTSAASSAVYTIDPPIPGVRKTIVCSTANGPVYLKTVNSETIQSTVGSSFTTIKGSSVGGCFDLVGLTTAIWAAIGITSGTSSQASSFGLSTTT